MNRITISETKLASVDKIYKSGKYRKPKSHIDWQRYKDLDFPEERIFYTEALNNKVNKDYKVSYCSDKLALIQSSRRISFEKLQEFADLTKQSKGFDKILLAKNNNLLPALRSSASNNPLQYHFDYILQQANKRFKAEKRNRPTDMVVIDI